MVYYIDGDGSWDADDWDWHSLDGENKSYSRDQRLDGSSSHHLQKILDNVHSIF